jgi:DNA repair exonuclease SbcCD ATPase subunit
MRKALVIYTGVPVALEDPKLESDLEKLELKLVQVNQRLLNVNTFIHEGLSRLNGIKSNIVTNINVLDAEISELTRLSHELREGTKKAHEPIMEETDPPPDVESCTKNLKVMKAECKKLFRRIAMLSHPDRVNDVKKNRLFEEARVAYKENDLITLENVASNLFSTKRDLRSLEKLRKRFEMLKQDYDNKSKLLEETLNSKNHRIVHLYTYGDAQGRAQALSTYETHLREQLFVRQQSVQRLREYVNRLRAAQDAKKGGYTVTVTYIGGSGGYTYVTPPSDG